MNQEAPKGRRFPQNTHGLTQKLGTDYSFPYFLPTNGGQSSLCSMQGDFSTRFVAAVGMFVGAVGAAFTTTTGPGGLDMEGKSAAELTALVEALRVDTEYVTCLVRFSRVFDLQSLWLLATGVVIFRGDLNLDAPP